MSVRKVALIAVLWLALVACLSLTLRIVWLPLATFRGHTGRVISVVASPDGKSLVSVSDDKMIKLWDVATRKERATLRGSDATFSLDGKTLAWAEGGAIRFWRMGKGKEPLTLRGHSGNVYSLAFSPDGKT